MKSIFMVMSGYNDFKNNHLTLRNGLDMGIGVLGAAAGIVVLATTPVGWVATGCIVVGYASTIYGTATTVYDLYDEYNDEYNDE